MTNITPSLPPPWSSEADQNSFGAQLDKENYGNVQDFNPKTDVSAEEWVNVANNVVAARNVAPFAVIEIQCNDSAPAAPTVLAFKGMHAVGRAFAPTLTRLGDGYFMADFEDSYSDFYGQDGSLSLTMAEASCSSSAPNTHGGYGNAIVTSATRVYVNAWTNSTTAKANALVMLKVWVGGDS